MLICTKLAKFKNAKLSITWYGCCNHVLSARTLDRRALDVRMNEKNSEEFRVMVSVD
jgi:hypothetical protein